MMGKMVVSAVSLLLVVGVVIGIVAGINRHSSPTSPENSSPSIKAITAICQPTDFREACVNSLKGVAQNGSATPHDLVQAALQATIAETDNALAAARQMVAPTNQSRTQMELEDCTELLQYAIDELQASFSMVGETQLHTVSDRVDELMNWVSAVVSYQQSCLDGLSDPTFKSSMNTAMLNATQLTSNALAIVSEFSDILTTFNPDQKSTTMRSLVETEEVAEVDENLPSWFAAGDRRLLAAGVTPNAVVAQDGSGKYKSINAALAAYPKNHKGRFVIYVKAGVYNEEVVVDKGMMNVFMYGDGPRKSIVTGKKSYSSGYTTFRTASFAVMGNGFLAKGMGFTNTAGPEGHQAVALRVQADMAAFFNCRMDGYQDTLYAQALRQFYRNCVISGTVDFIFGDAAALIQNSLIIVRKPMENQQNAVTAQGRADRRQTTGIVIHNCRIVPEEKLFPSRLLVKTFLGRPWKEFSRTIIMESELGDLIQGEGWMAWQGDFALNTLFYAEYNNRGPGSKTDRRVRWKGYKVINNKNEALQFTAGPFIKGGLWLKYTGAPFLLGLKN